MKKTLLLGLAIATTIYASAQTPTTDPAKSQNEVVTADKVECCLLYTSPSPRD